MKQLEDSLRRLGTDHLDLWQIHECVSDDDPDLHFAPDGVVDATTTGPEGKSNELTSTPTKILPKFASTVSAGSRYT